MAKIIISPRVSNGRTNILTVKPFLILAKTILFRPSYDAIRAAYAWIVAFLPLANTGVSTIEELVHFDANLTSQCHFERVRDESLLLHIIETTSCSDVSAKASQLENTAALLPLSTATSDSLVYERLEIWPTFTNDTGLGYDLPSHRHADDGDLAY